MDGLRNQRRQEGAASESSLEDPLFTTHHSLCDEPAMVRMVTNAVVLPKVADILGWNIAVYHAHVSVNPPRQEPKALGNRKILGFHRDSGRVNQELEVPAGCPVPRLSVKCAYYLTDISGEGYRAQTWVIPGSHLRPASDDAELLRSGSGPAEEQQPTGAISLRVPANTCVVLGEPRAHM